MKNNYVIRSMWFTSTLCICFVTIYSLLVTGFSSNGIIFCGVTIIVSYNYATALATGFATLLIRRRMFLDIPYDSALQTTDLVVICVPCLLSEKSVIENILKTVELNTRTFKNSSATFVLLADYVDVPFINLETEFKDKELLRLISDGIYELNHREGNRRLGLLVRPRVWSEAEGIWMGWERKRGKIEALMNLMITGDSSVFDVINCDTARLSQSEFLCVLDADTRLTEGGIDHLIQVARSPQGHRFHILQPGSRPLESEPVNLYQWVTVNPFPPLNIWQDIFGRSKFVGKGLYRVKEVRELFAKCIPDSWVLSHDVMESSIACTGAVDQVYFCESSPRTFAENLRRLDRWYRGDWQNFPWAIPQSIRYRIFEFSKLRRVSIDMPLAWMIVDLLMRDLHPQALLILISFSLFQVSSSHFLLLVLILEATFMFTTLFAKWTRGESSSSLLEIFRTAMFFIFSIATLPSHAWTATRSLCVAVIRMFITKHKLLEWVASSELSSKGVSNWIYIGPQIAYGIFLLTLGFGKLQTLTIAFGIMFLCFPLVIYGMELISILPTGARHDISIKN